jgi:hypothetical protein
LPQTQYLVDVVTASQPALLVPQRTSDRILWVAELFVALGERQRLRA